MRNEYKLLTAFSGGLTTLCAKSIVYSWHNKLNIHRENRPEIYTLCFFMHCLFAVALLILEAAFL